MYRFDVGIGVLKWMLMGGGKNAGAVENMGKTSQKCRNVARISFVLYICIVHIIKLPNKCDFSTRPPAPFFCLISPFPLPALFRFTSISALDGVSLFLFVTLGSLSFHSHSPRLSRVCHFFHHCDVVLNVSGFIVSREKHTHTQLTDCNKMCTDQDSGWQIVLNKQSSHYTIAMKEKRKRKHGEFCHLILFMSIFCVHKFRTNERRLFFCPCCSTSFNSVSLISTITECRRIGSTVWCCTIRLHASIFYIHYLSSTNNKIIKFDAKKREHLYLMTINVLSVYCVCPCPFK